MERSVINASSFTIFSTLRTRDIAWPTDVIVYSLNSSYPLGISGFRFSIYSLLRCLLNIAEILEVGSTLIYLVQSSLYAAEALLLKCLTALKAQTCLF